MKKYAATTCLFCLKFDKGVHLSIQCVLSILFTVHIELSIAFFKYELYSRDEQFIYISEVVQ